MSCYHSAEATIIGGYTGSLLIIKIKVATGIIDPILSVRGKRPFNPMNVFPVEIFGTLPGDIINPIYLEHKENLSKDDKFDFVEIFCGHEKSGTRIPVTKA